jgi:HlyD family secretion protein
MRGVEIKLEDLTDSREVMESKESPKIRWFIIILTALIVIALLFSCFFKMDEYVTVNGEIKTEDVSGNITSLSSCKLKEINVVEGQEVSKGDVLFSLDIDYAQKQYQLVQDSLQENQSRLDDLDTLLNSVKAGENLFSDESNAYSYRYEQFRSSLDVTVQELENSISSNELSAEENQEKLNSLNQQIADTEDLITQYQVLIDCINNGYAYSGNATVYAVYLMYESDCEKAALNEETYWDNYSDVVDKYNNQQYNITASEIQQAQNDYESALNAVSALTNEYATQINNQIVLLQSQAIGSDDADLTNQINEYSNLLNAIKGGYSFTFDDLSVQQIFDEYNNQYTSLYDDYQEKLAAYNALYDEYSIQSARVSESDITNAANSYNSAAAQTSSVKSTYISNAQTSIDNAKAQLVSLESQKTSVEYALKSPEDPEKYAETTKEKLLNEEIVSIDTEIDSVKSNVDSMESQLAELENTIENGTLTATVDGTVALLADLTVGDVIEAGSSLCTIVPSSSSLKAILYIPESDISKIEEGQKIEYVFDSLPYAEYGKINGSIISISADAVADEDNGTKYYLAQADLSELSLTNKDNEVRTVQTGQLCQAKIISGSKKVIIWLLEKINLKD